MAEVPQDEVVYTMVDGQTFRRYVTAGSGGEELSILPLRKDEWLHVDGGVIRIDMIVSAKFQSHDSEPPTIG
jgi:hypothetical protein